MNAGNSLTQDLRDFERFLDEQTWSPTTITLYRYIVSRLVEWMKGNDLTSLEDLEIRNVKEFILKSGWGNSMARKLNSVLVQYCRTRYGADHPLTKWRVKRELAPPQRTVEDGQSLQLLASFNPGISEDYSNKARRFLPCDTAQPLGIRNYALLWLLLDTGFRSAEICNLKIDNLNMGASQVTGRVKFGKWRTADFSDNTAEALRAWLIERETFVSKRSTNSIFIGVMNGYEGVPLTPAGLRALLRKLGKLSDIGKLSPHDFRRGFVTHALRAGASVRAVQEAGGWSNAEMVLHYGRAIKASEIIPFLPGNTLDVSAVYTSATQINDRTSSRRT